MGFKNDATSRISLYVHEIKSYYEKKRGVRSEFHAQLKRLVLSGRKLGSLVQI